MLPNIDVSSPSSPDPLGNSSLADTTLLSPTKPAVRRTPLNKTTTPIKNSTSNIKLQDFILKTPPAGLLQRAQSPTKSTAKTENLLSPWRIRVTVEAERDEGKKVAGDRTSERVGRSVTKKGTARTTTTLVPLKGLEDSSPPPASRRSARSRKSDVGSSPTKGGGVAALVRKRGRRTTGDDDAGRDLSVGATPGKRGRGRPRRSLPVIDDEDVVMGETEAGSSKPAATPLVKQARGKRKAISPVNIAVDDDLDGDIFYRRRKRRVRRPSVVLGETSPNRSLSASPRKGLSDTHSAPTAVPQTVPTRDSSTHSFQQNPDNAEKQMHHSATPANPDHPLLITAVADGDSIGDDPAILADPTNDHREFDSILESEGFSMVSLESIESARRNLRGITNPKLRPQAKPTKTNFLTDPALQPPRLADEVPKTGPLSPASLQVMEYPSIQPFAVPAPAPAPASQQVMEYPSLQPEQLLSPERSDREDEMDWQVDTPVMAANLSLSDSVSSQNMLKPRRGKIPSPWRRDSQIVYSDEATEDPSGLFWQPDQRAIQLAKERVERRRRKESHLDVSSMLKKTEKVNEETRVIATSVDEPPYTASEPPYTASEPPYTASEPVNMTTERLLNTYLHFIRTHPPEPQPPPPPPTTWIDKFANLATTFILGPIESWTNAEYHLLDALYQSAKRDPTICAYNPANGGLFGFRLSLGHTIPCPVPNYPYRVRVNTRHLGVVDKFRDMVRLASLRQGGDGKVEWGELHVLCRLASLIIAEDMRARGILRPWEEEEEELEAVLKAREAEAEIETVCEGEGR